MNTNTEGVFRFRQKENSFEMFQASGNAPSKLTFTRRSFDIMDLVFWIAFAVSQVVAVVCLVLVVYWCILYGGFSWNEDANLQFFVHPLCMVLGLILCYGDALLVYRVGSFLPKMILKVIHAAMHLAAIVLSTIGLVAVFENHRRTDKADLYSLHSWVGLATFAFFCLQYVASFITFLFPGLPAFIRTKFMPFHTFFGVGIFLMAVATAQMGITERLIWTSGYSSGDISGKGVVGNVLGLFFVVFAFLVVFLVTQERYKRKPLPND